MNAYLFASAARLDQPAPRSVRVDTVAVPARPTKRTPWGTIPLPVDHDDDAPFTAGPSVQLRVTPAPTLVDHNTWWLAAPRDTPIRVTLLDGPHALSLAVSAHGQRVDGSALVAPESMRAPTRRRGRGYRIIPHRSAHEIAEALRRVVDRERETLRAVCPELAEALEVEVSSDDASIRYVGDHEIVTDARTLPADLLALPPITYSWPYGSRVTGASAATLRRRVEQYSDDRAERAERLADMRALFEAEYGRDAWFEAGANARDGHTLPAASSDDSSGPTPLSVPVASVLADTTGVTPAAQPRLRPTFVEWQPSQDLSAKQREVAEETDAKNRAHRAEYTKWKQNPDAYTHDWQTKLEAAKATYAARKARWRKSELQRQRREQARAEAQAESLEPVSRKASSRSVLQGAKRFTSPGATDVHR